MMQILNFFGGLLGYILWFFYIIVRNYGVAIILFTVVVKCLLFPFSIKQQKSMAAQSKMAAKQKELQARYGNDKMKYNEELQKLYEKEGISPMGGCLTTLLPFPIMLGLYYSVVFPLRNVLHLPSESVDQALALLQRIPGVGVNFSANSFYNEIELVKHFDSLKDHLTGNFYRKRTGSNQLFVRRFSVFGTGSAPDAPRQRFYEYAVADPGFVLGDFLGQSVLHDADAAWNAATAGLHESNDVCHAADQRVFLLCNARCYRLLLDYFHPDQLLEPDRSISVLQPGPNFGPVGGAACGSAVPGRSGGGGTSPCGTAKTGGENFCASAAKF